MGFHEVRFPAALSFGSVGGPERRTEIVALVNGYEERNTPWEHSRRHYDAGLGLRSLEDVEAGKKAAEADAVEARETAAAQLAQMRAEANKSLKQLLAQLRANEEAEDE